MPLFVISCRDKPGSLELRLSVRERHLAYANNSGIVRLGGPYLDDKGDMCGSLIIVETETIEQAQAFHADDPYKLAGLFESSAVTPWRLTAGTLG